MVITPSLRPCPCRSVAGARQAGPGSWRRAHSRLHAVPRASSPLALVLASILVAGACGSAPASPTPPAPGASAPSASPPAAASAATTAGSACTPPTTPASRDWNQRTWYQVFVRSFADGDGDGIGDFRGLTAKLDYLNDGDPATTDDLGVGGLWLMPVAESPSYHGYDVTDYRALERDYGTREDF